MTDLTVEQRLAELQARGRTSVDDSVAPATTPEARLDTSGPTVHDRLDELRARRTGGAHKQGEAPRRVLADVSYVPPVALAELAESAATARPWALSREWSANWTPSRVAATGASVVSAAAVVVAMGPLLKSVAVPGEHTVDAATADAVAGAQVPASPSVDVQVAPVSADGNVLGAMPVTDELVPLAGTAPVAVDLASTVDQTQPPAADTTTPATVATTAVTTASTATTATTATSNTQPPSTAAPTTAAPATAAPTTAPTTAAPTTAAPTTAAPTTTTPPTAPTTTAPPTTATTAPPTSQASGG